MNEHLRFILGRLLYIALFVTIQVAALVIMFLYFWDKFPYFYIICILLSLSATVHILNNTTNPAYKIAWLIPVLLFPIFGGLLYLLFGKYRMTRKEKAAGRAVLAQITATMGPEHAAMEIVDADYPDAALHARYLLRATGTPPSLHTQTEYLPLGETMFAAMLRELENAQDFIFMEYFIVDEGIMLDTIIDILKRKVQQGVEVRFLYDDLGSLFTLPRHYDRQLRELGIRAKVFNPFNTILSPRFNNRDHRKVCIIDGRVGFTGGINLADEYINAFQKHGHWKDSGILLRGDAVWSMTVQFLSIWDFSTGELDDFARYRPDPSWAEHIPSDGIVLPYTDLPLDEELVGETVYLNLINRAKNYVYITTPYLILDNETVTALCTAAKSGVDVRIITPHIPDKKIVFFLTRANYDVLLRAGVRIFEYTPGFIHAKTMVADGQYAVVGTINLDFRSLYLHVEDAVWMYRSQAVGQVYEDFLQTQACSQEVMPAVPGRQSWLKQLWLGVLRAFAPLL